MDGFETVRQLQMAYPKIKCIALSVNDDFVSVFKMINAGVKAYLLKDSQPDRIKEALLRVYQQGVYYDGFVVQKIMDFQTAAATKNPLEKSSVGHDFSNREIDFIRYCCSELSYKEIAEKMGVSSRTVDGYRDSVFTKLGIKSRVSVVLYAVDSGIYMPAHVFATN
jgi:DNA-binding NarL/FixJ family response regulator